MSIEPEAAELDRNLGIRERSKRDKRRRIERAAREVFRERGYEGATMREIATRADVALGTLFAYAHDKRDLFMMCINADLDALTVSANERLREDAPLLDQILEIYRARYEFWASQPALARAAMREFNAPYVDDDDAGVELRRGEQRRNQVINEIADLIRRKRLALGVELHDDDETYAWMIGDLYLTEARLWLNDRNPTVEAGLGRLRRLMKLALHGTGLNVDATRF